MSDLISREKAIWAIDNDDEYAYYQTRRNIESIPSADIMECARAIKEYCKDRIGCAECRFYIERNGKSVCRLHMNVPNWWDLPEGEEKSCNTCKNSDDEFSGECYECVKGIFDHYESEGEKGGE